MNVMVFAAISKPIKSLQILIISFSNSCRVLADMRYTPVCVIEPGQMPWNNTNASDGMILGRSLKKRLQPITNAHEWFA